MLVEDLGDVVLKHVAVQDVQNTAGNFVCQYFEGPAFGDRAINPTNNGIIFFRFYHPPYDTRIRDQLQYFMALHQQIGLDAVVLFEDDLNIRSEETLAVLAGINRIDPGIKILMSLTGRHFDASLEEVVRLFSARVKELDQFVLHKRGTAATEEASALPQGFVDRFYLNLREHPRRRLQEILGIDPRFRTAFNRQALDKIEEAYLAKSPLLAKPGELAKSAPVSEWVWRIFPNRPWLIPPEEPLQSGRQPACHPANNCGDS